MSKPFRQLPLPPRTRVLSVLRENAVLPPELVERLQPDDYVLALCPPEQIIRLDRLFVPKPRSSPRRPEVNLGDFAFAGETPLGRLADEYDLPMTRQEREVALADYLRSQIKGPPSVGDRARIGNVVAIVQTMDGERIAQVGLRLDPYKAHLLPMGLRAWIGDGVRRLRAWIVGGLVRFRPPGRAAPAPQRPAPAPPNAAEPGKVIELKRANGARNGS